MHAKELGKIYFLAQMCGHYPIIFKGIENIKNEIEDSAEPLIDPVYGHGR